MKIDVKVLEEAGHMSALLGMALSYKPGDVTVDEWWTDHKKTRARARAEKLAHKQGGHNKFLESIQVWLLVTAPRYWWQQYDTYRSGVTKQSESTMHTLAKRPPTRANFSDDTPQPTITTFIELWRHTNLRISELKAALPDGFLQTRVICTNYKALQHVVNQRVDHRLGAWGEFFIPLSQQLQNPEYVFSKEILDELAKR